MRNQPKPEYPMYYLGRPRALYEKSFPQRPRPTDR